MNIADAILLQGENHNPALIYRQSRVTYAELRRRVAGTAGAMLTRGYAKGERIGIFAENCPFFVSSYLGIIRAGLVAVPFQTDVNEETFAKIISDAEVKAVFVSKRFLSRVQTWIKSDRVSLLAEPVVSNWTNESPEQTPDIDPVRDLAALMFTSGSTGAPKGVMVSHRNIESNTRDIVAYMGLRPEDRAMVVLPFHYCFGASLLHTHLMCGGSLVLNNEFRLYPENVLQEMIAMECTGLAGVPSTFQLLLRKSRIRDLSFPSLRWFQQAGGKLANPYINEIQEIFPAVRYFLMYGQTEATARLSYLAPDYLCSKLGSIGRGLPSTRLNVLKPDGTEVRPGSDETGEIVATGPNITLGYWRDPVESSRYFRNGRLHTGDIARVDEDGFIFIVEREREIIKSGGNRVSAKEIEDIIAEIPEVVEVAAVGLPHELLGEAIKAFVVLNNSSIITPEFVRDHCRKRLPSFKVPEEIIFLQTLPHNSSGKVIKQKLKQIGLAQDRAFVSGTAKTTVQSHLVGRSGPDTEQAEPR